MGGFRSVRSVYDTTVTSDYRYLWVGLHPYSQRRLRDITLVGAGARSSAGGKSRPVPLASHLNAPLTRERSCHRVL
jgi:hypothetical protein